MMHALTARLSSARGYFARFCGDGRANVSCSVTVIVVVAMFLPRGNVATFLLVGVAIAVVMGGTQALSRSFFSLLIPHGREGEYFALYNACERGTSWFGTFLFGVVFQITGSYRPAIVALIVFFVLGAGFLLRLDPARGVAEAGNALPVGM